MKNLKIIYRLSINGLMQTLANRNVFVIFFLTKVVRYGLFILFLFYLLSGVQTLNGYSREQVLFFYLTFNLIDTSAQLLFREVYRFRPMVVSGDFDLVLSKPFNPLVRVLFGGPDFIDFGVLLILLSVIVWYLVAIIHPGFVNVLLYITLVFNALLIAAAFHIATLALGIITLAVDNIIMIYRDFTALMRLPIDIYTNPLRSFLTFVIPVGIMFSFPAKALLGMLSWQWLGISFLIGISLLFLSLAFWQYALKKYQSASS